MLKHFWIVLLLLMVACSKEKAVDQGGGGNSNETTIDSIEGKIYNYTASESFLEVTLGPVVTSKGDLVSPSDKFKLTSNNAQLLLGQLNANDISSFSSNLEVSPEQEGIIKFKIKAPTASGVYNVSIQALSYSSAVGLVYVQINPAQVANLGTAKSDLFKDSPPYNGLKDSAEPFAVVNGSDTLVTLGPVVDRFGNKVTSGTLDVLLTNGYFSNVTLDGGAVSQADIPVINGEAKFSAQILDATQNLRIMAAVAGSVETETDFQNLPPGMFIDSELVVVDSVISIIGLTGEDEVDFGVVYVGQNQVKTINLKNLGNSRVFALTAQVDAPFLRVGGTCSPEEPLNPGAECSIDLKYDAQSRVLGFGNLTIGGRFSGVAMPQRLIALRAQAAIPATLQLSLDNNIIDFEPTPVGDVITQTFTIVNQGDVDADNLRFLQPPPHPGQNTSFFLIRSLPESVPNNDPSAGEHCGQVIVPQKRCKIYVDFFPQGKVGNDILAGNIVIDGSANPITLFVKGRSFINNFERTIGIASVNYNIKKDEVDVSQVVVGPVRGIDGLPVADQDVAIQVFRYSDEARTIRQHLGAVTSPNLIIGGLANTYTIRTDAQGYANFNLKSKIYDEVGSFIVEATIKDAESNTLASGTNEQFKFLGVNLAFDLDIYNYAKTVVQQKVIKQVTVLNKGSLDAQNVGLNFSEDYFIIENEGTCAGITNAGLSLPIGSSCSFSLSFTPNQRTSFFSYMRILSSNFGTKDIADVYGIGISPVDLNSETPKVVATHNVGQSQPLQGMIVFNNVGDETAVDLAAKALAENQSFDFNFTCTQLESGRTCVLNYSYNPVVIPNPVLNTQISIIGVGQFAGLPNEITIPVSINHSSMNFTGAEPGININKCHELEVVAVDTEEDNLDYSQNIELTLSNESAPGAFYFDLNCTTPIYSILINANTFKTNKFYYKATQPGFHVLSANSPELASAIKGFKIYKEPVGVVIAGGDAQNVFTEKTLDPPLIVKMIDEDGAGVPNIPVNFKILEDITQKPQLILNPGFNTGTSSWTTSAGAQWFRGYGGTLRLASLTQSESATSSAIAVNPGDLYYYAVRVSESIGTPATAAVKIELLKSSNNAVIQEIILEGKKSQVFKFIPQAGQDLIKIRLSTVGYSIGTAAFIDGVYFTQELSLAPANAIRYGSIANSTTQTGFTGEGEAVVQYTTGDIPGLNIIQADSTYFSLLNPSVIASVNVDFPTNITGVLGDLRVATTGVTLENIGGNNLSSLSSLAGYNWNATTKTLTLPGKQSYDFNSITVDTGTTLQFSAPAASKEYDWTKVYAKQSCIVDGKIESKGYQASGTDTISVNSVGIDGETLTSEVEPSSTGQIGGMGGEGGYVDQIRTRSAQVVCYKYCSSRYPSTWKGWQWSVGGWSGWGNSGSFNSQYSRLDGNLGTVGTGGSGATGRPGKYGTTVKPVGGTGGLGGNNGGGGGLLFLHCFISLQGSGTIDVNGQIGSVGGNGIAGSYFVGTSATNRTEGRPGGLKGNINNVRNPVSVEEIRRILVSGGGGGGAGGNGGRGGHLVVKSKNLNGGVSYSYFGALPGNGGLGGGNTYNYPEANGAQGNSGAAGELGTCQQVLGISVISCQ